VKKKENKRELYPQVNILLLRALPFFFVPLLVWPKKEKGNVSQTTEEKIP